MTLITSPTRAIASEALVNAARDLRDDGHAPGSLARLFRALADYLAVDIDHGIDSWREVREDAKLSLREVSRRTEINPGRLSIIERGVPPTPEEAERIRAAIAAGPPAE